MSLNNQQSFSSSFSYSSSSYSSYSSSNGVNTSGTRHATESHRDPSGHTTVRTASQNLGEPIIQETRSYDASGREVLGRELPSTGTGAGTARIEDVTDRENQPARDYEERIEDEYAKREGGA